MPEKKKVWQSLEQQGIAYVMVEMEER